MSGRIQVLIISFVFAAVIGCGGGGSSDKDSGTDGDGSATLPSKVGLNNPKALFILNGNGSSSVSAKATTGKKSDSSGTVGMLYQVFQNGNVSKVAFTKADGTEVRLDVRKMRYISDSYIALNIKLIPSDSDSEDSEDGEESGTSDEYMPKNVLVDVSTGTVYDFHSYLLFSNDMISSAPIIYDNCIYTLNTTDVSVMSSGTLYKINLATKTATAMNNPDYLFASRFYHIGNGDFVVLDSGKARLFVLRHDGSAPVSVADSQYAQVSEMTTLSGGDSDSIGMTYGADGKLYDVDCEYVADASLPEGYKFVFKTLTFSADSTGLVITSAPVCQIPAAYSTTNTTWVKCSSDGMNDRNRMLICRAGYVTMNTNDQGGFDFSYGTKDLSSLLEKITVWNGTNAYYVESNKLMRWDVASAVAASPIISDQSVNSVWTMGGEIYYTVYVSATSVQTWKIASDGSRSKVGDSNMSSQSIVEFTI